MDTWGEEGHGSLVGPSPWGPSTPWSNMASKVALMVKCTNATQDAKATMLPLPGHGINATRYRNKTHMEVTAALVTAHPPLAGLAWHALLLGIIFFFYMIFFFFIWGKIIGAVESTPAMSFVHRRLCLVGETWSGRRCQRWRAVGQSVQRCTRL